jgi:hypothetical protein
MKEMEPVCSACGKQYDLRTWQGLPLLCVGATGSGNTATSIVQERICTCGRSVSISVPLPDGTSEAHADMLVQAALVEEADRDRYATKDEFQRAHTEVLRRENSAFQAMADHDAGTSKKPT